MTRYAIIEDNLFALQNLRQNVERLRHDYEMVYSGGSIAGAVEFLRSGTPVDLIFMDIELSDGPCFQIFEQIQTVVPIIFTTAYDDFALRAFKVNSVDYLLKPVTGGDVAAALDKYELLHTAGAATSPAAAQPAEARPAADAAAGRVLTVSGDSYSYIDLDDVAWFKSEDNYIFACLSDGGKKMINLTNLSKLEQVLPADRFFRLSRSFVASISSVENVSKYFRGRLMVTLRREGETEKVSVTSGRRDEFLAWLGH